MTTAEAPQTFYPQSRLHHYIEAERLLAEGVEVVNKIASATTDYHPYGANGGMTQEVWVRARRDDLGKKAMGIWAQAQVHATLANAAPTLDLSKPITYSAG